MNLEKTYKDFTKNIKFFKKNPIKISLVFLLLIIITLVFQYGTIFSNKLGENLIEKLSKNPNKSISISQILFNEDDNNFTLEFSIQNESIKKILIKKISVNLSKHAPETGGGGPLDMDSSYNITFDSSLIKLDLNNRISINGKTYISYIRNYNNNFNKDGLFLFFEAPFIVNGDSYTSFRLTIPKNIKIINKEIKSNLGLNSESDDIQKLTTKINNISKLSDIYNIVELNDLQGIFINLYTDKDDLISGEKSLNGCPENCN